MDKSEIKPGSDYALREKLGAGKPVQRVRILEHARGDKWKAQWVDGPKTGLIDYVESRNLVATWKGVRAFVKEEEAEGAIHEENKRSRYRKDSPVDNAMGFVLGWTGDEIDYHRGCLIGQPDVIGRVMTRAGLDPLKRFPYAYVDRAGVLHLPYSQAKEIAEHFAAAEPQTMLANIEAAERKARREGGRPGDEFMVQFANEDRAAFAMIMQWAGHEAAIAQKEDEKGELKELLRDAINALEEAGRGNLAGRLRRAIGDRPNTRTPIGVKNKKPKEPLTEVREGASAAPFRRRGF